MQNRDSDTYKQDMKNKQKNRAETQITVSRQLPAYADKGLCTQAKSHVRRI